MPCFRILSLLCVIAAVSAHDIYYKTRLVCGPEGPPTQIEWMLFNDYGPRVNLTQIGVTNGYVPGVTINFGPTVGCTTSTCRVWSQTMPNWGEYPPPSPYANSIKYITMDLVPNPTYAACKANSNTNCGDPFRPVNITGKAYWDITPHTINPWSKRVAITESYVSGANCPSDAFNCPNPPTTTCGIGSCRCNKFEFLAIKTNPTTKQTQISVNVTNNCADSFYYAAFGLNDDLTLVSPTHNANYQGTNYQWTVNVVTIAEHPKKWVRFVTKAGVNGDPKFTNKTGQGPAWDVFTFTVSGYLPTHLWTVQGHQGPKWDTFTNVDVSLCPCPNCDSTTSECPTKPGYSGDNCDECDRSPPPGDGSYTWFCLANSNPSNPWQLVKVPTNRLGAAPYTSPGFVPSNADGSLKTDPAGYVINCNCTRKIYDCQPLSFCSGHGTCVPQNGTCICDQGFFGPDCQPATTQPTTSVVTNTATNQATTIPPVTTTTVPPPCYNNGLYCSGRASCEHGACQCPPLFSGAACEGIVSTNNTRYCDEFNTCDSCSNGAAAIGLQCSWCRDVQGGGCIASSNCLNVFTSCGATGVSFVPEPCPDDCSGNHGSCVNTTCSEFAKQGKEPPKLNGQLLCINDSASFQFDADQNATVYVENNYLSYCVCKKGYTGKNCGGRSSALGKALAISGGVIAAIVIAGVIVVLIIAFGAKKGVDFVLLNQQATSNFKINPTHENRDQEHFSGIHQ